MLDVEKIVLQLFHNIPDGIAVFIIDLSPSRDAGLDRVPEVIKRNHGRELFDKMRPLRPGPYQAHISQQDIDELRQLIQPRSAQNLAYSVTRLSPGFDHTERCPFRHLPASNEISTS